MVGCAHCGSILHFDESSRLFRWEDLDPYIRTHGGTRTSLWGSFAAGCLWLLILVATLAEQGPFNFPLFAALAVPYLALATWLVFSRARLPADRWLPTFLYGMAGFCGYLWVLFLLVPDWAGFIFVGGLDRVLPESLIFVAGVLAGSALLLSIQYKHRLSRIPMLSGAPPRV